MHVRFSVTISFMTEHQRPEREASVPLRYTPEGYWERLSRLSLPWQEAIFAQERLARTVSPDIQSAILNAVIDGTDVSLDFSNPAIAGYRDAVQLDHNYRLAVHREREIAKEYLQRLAEPLNPDPPMDMWGRVEMIAETEVSTLRVPFTIPELIAISTATDARQQLIIAGDQQSGAERKFSIESKHFPSEAHSTPVSIGLTHRPSAIWGIMIAARAAEDALTNFSGTEWEPKGATAGQFVIVRDLPDKLIRHKPPTVKE